MRKTLCILLLLTLTNILKAQVFRGRVLDIMTKEALAGVSVKGRSISVTNNQGDFILSNAIPGDTIRIFHLGYKVYVFTFNALHPGFAAENPPEIELEPDNILLTEVLVRANRIERIDSIRNRKAFASEFAYKTPSLKSILVLKSPKESMHRHVDVHRGNNNYSASNIIKIDALQMINFLSKNKTEPSKLQKTLLQDEGDKYIDRVFSKETIISITKLTGDSLKNFMIRYRPTLKLAKSNTEYEMIDYIRQKHLEFIK